MFIVKVLPLDERQYVSQSGEQKVFASRQLVLSDGIDTLCAELTGDLARRENWPLNEWTKVQVNCFAREYKDKNGKARFSNDLIINRIGL